ncbi:unnamed protein product [Effrenium voratum]|uniref:Uncharacterized protein n=1 Tax=Effrenium voratum TaxID=2562239 RepID=A0AA36MJZ5_9DINO|nr:unnamed protein product [Effrenium voratum]
MAMAPSMEESLDVVKQALQESLMKAEEAIDLTDGEAQEALRRSEQEKEELMQELRYLRAEVSRLQDSGATEATCHGGAWLPWSYWCVSCTPPLEAEVHVLKAKSLSRG